MRATKISGSHITAFIHLDASTMELTTGWLGFVTLTMAFLPIFVIFMPPIFSNAYTVRRTVGNGIPVCCAMPDMVDPCLAASIILAFLKSGIDCIITYIN